MQANKSNSIREKMNTSEANDETYIWMGKN